MDNYFIENFEKFWPDHSNLFLGLDFQVIFKILSSDKLKNGNQHIVWRIIHNWIEVDTFNRLTYFKLLFKNCLQCDQLTAQFFEDTIFQSNVFRLLPLVFQKELKSFVNKNKQHLLVCINKYGSVEFYDAQCSGWHLSSSISVRLPNKHKYFQLTLLDSVLYAFGGMINNSTATNQMWRWSRDISNLSQSQWTARAPMNQSRNWFSSVVLNGTIYALGGWDNNFHPLLSCERYDSQLNQWSADVAPMNRRRRSASAAVINDYIYIAGGLSENEEPLRSVEKYDPQTNTWRKVAPMTTGRWVFALTPFAGRLWAIGGLCNKTQPLSTCESYDPVTDTWQKEAPMKSWRCQHAAIDFNGELYVVGGKRNYDSTVVEKYVPAIGWVNDGNIRKEYNDPHLLVIPHAYSPNFITFS